MPTTNRDSESGIKVRPASSGPKPMRRKFPGPRDANVSLRVAIDRAAYADLVAHAKESLSAEVCGVLAGQICEDDEGMFVHVEALIRGNAASHGATHVTFTQATWDAIHQTLEREYPKLRIVGWYHTHPGFGVEFSEMDLFIQRNFFPDPTQIALVTDPMSGAVAIAVNSSSAVEYLTRFWVDGREQTAVTPARPAATAAPASSAAPAGDLAQTIKMLESRVSQLLQAHDEQRASYHRFLYTVGFVACTAIAVLVGYTIFNAYSSRFEPPRLNNIVPIPIQVGDKTVIVGVGVVQWDVPQELNAAFLQLEKLKQEELRKREELKSAAPTKPAARPATPGEPQPSSTTQPESKP